MIKELEDIQQFHEKFGLAYDGPPRVLPPELRGFRARFMLEELHEFNVSNTRADTLDALVDLHYVALGTVYLSGLQATMFDENPPLGGLRVYAIDQSIRAYELAETPEAAAEALWAIHWWVSALAFSHDFQPIFREAWDRVHRANMAKVRAERASDSKRGSSFDVVKPEGWQAPDLGDLVNEG